MGRKPVIDTKLALRMKLKGVSNTAIAKMQGVSQGAVSKRLKPLLACIPNSAYMQEYQDNQADKKTIDLLVKFLMAL
jgi:predicted transcriptional regulator